MTAPSLEAGESHRGVCLAQLDEKVDKARQSGSKADRAMTHSPNGERPDLVDVTARPANLDHRRRRNTDRQPHSTERHHTVLDLNAVGRPRRPPGDCDSHSEPPSADDQGRYRRRVVQDSGNEQHHQAATDAQRQEYPLVEAP